MRFDEVVFIAAASPSANQRGALVLFGAVVVSAVALYLLPTLVAAVRGARDLGSVAAVNILLGWSLVGWAVAWALALRDRPVAAKRAGLAARAGWYPDPAVPGRLRYWTGSSSSDALAQPISSR